MFSFNLFLENSIPNFHQDEPSLSFSQHAPDAFLNAPPIPDRSLKNENRMPFDNTRDIPFPDYPLPNVPHNPPMQQGPAINLKKEEPEVEVKENKYFPSNI